MCTVTFLPDGKGGFILTSNRDEKLVREKATIPSVSVINNQKVLFPKDPVSGGSWIAFSETGRSVCLLNGAFEPHTPSPPYAKSRGLVLLDSFLFSNPEDFLQEYPLGAIEPFTLIQIENQSLWELRWDGTNRHLEQLSYSRPFIWASATLYPQEVRMKRKTWFDQWLSKNTADLNAIRSFHKFAGDGDIRNDFVINRDNEMVTQSITSIQHIESEPRRMIYEDLLEKQTYISGI